MLRIDRVGKRFEDDFAALQGVSLEIGRGEIAEEGQVFTLPALYAA